MMHRMQITMDPEIQSQVRSKAASQGLSVAEYIRRLIEQDLGDASKTVGVSSIFGLGASGGADIAGSKDEMLAEAAAEELRRESSR